MTDQPVAPRQVTVLGAGVVGLCCAAWLQRDGHEVTLIDRGDPGAGTSSGNAGMIQVEAVTPIATPGVLGRVPRMLLDPTGPLVVRPAYLHRIAPWLLRFVWAARRSSVERISVALVSLLDLCAESWETLVRDARAEDLWRRNGNLYVYRTRAAWDVARESHALVRRRGVELVDMGCDEMRQLEPALARDLHAGVYSPTTSWVASPLELSQRIFGLFRRGGGTFLRQNVTGVERAADGAFLLGTGAGPRRAPSLVIAAGAFSKPFARAAGSRVPLDSERGYHLWLPDPGVELRRPVLVGDHNFALTPMTGGLRLAGTDELGGLDLPPLWRRADILAELARPVVPDLRCDGAERWMGHRPALPDSLPVIGRAGGGDNVYLAFGHGHLGLTMAAATGRLVADLVAGRAPPVDIGPFAAGRF